VVLPEQPAELMVTATATVAAPITLAETFMPSTPVVFYHLAHKIRVAAAYPAARCTSELADAGD
jgi:hypothetical protein